MAKVEIIYDRWNGDHAAAEGEENNAIAVRHVLVNGRDVSPSRTALTVETFATITLEDPATVFFDGDGYATDSDDVLELTLATPDRRPILRLSVDELVVTGS